MVYPNDPKAIDDGRPHRARSCHRSGAMKIGCGGHVAPGARYGRYPVAAHFSGVVRIASGTACLHAIIRRFTNMAHLLPWPARLCALIAGYSTGDHHQQGAAAVTRPIAA